MAQARIAEWIGYWTRAKMVAFEEIQSLADMMEARKWCSCMRLGVFWNVTDEALWSALCQVRN